MTTTESTPATENQAAKHTPGPWEAHDNGLIYALPKDEEDESSILIGEFCQDGAGLHITEEERANGLLMAAAPDLLNALEGMLEIFVDSDQIGDYEDMETVKAARAAIVKARAA